MTDILLKIIEEFADGFLIINEEKRIVFFNDTLLKNTGLRSADILESEIEFLRTLGISNGDTSEHEAFVRGRDGGKHKVLVQAMPVHTEKGKYVLARVEAVPVPPPTAEESVRQWALLFNNIADPVLDVDLSGNVRAANPAFHKLIGYSAGDHLPNIGDLYVDSAELEDKIIRLSGSDTVYNLETHLRTKNNETIRVLDTAWVVRDDMGAVRSYTSHLKDITYVKNLEARLKISERNYMLLFDTMVSSIIIVDPMGRILNCNYYAERLYGYPRLDLVGRVFVEVFGVQRTARAMENIISAVNANGGRYVETDIPRRCRDGTIRFTYASYSAITSTQGETIAYSVMEKDLTERIRLEKKLHASFQRIKNTQSAAIIGFARLTEFRDKSTGKHLERIREYTRVLAAGLARMDKYRAYITAEYIDDLCLSSVLHDVGKVGIEDAILLKPGRLDTSEYERIKAHAALGGEALRSVDDQIRDQSFLTLGKEVAFYHHERWDGTGYPTGKKGEEIPLSARIVALADVYDALTSKRPYKDAISHEEAVRIIRESRGTHFDPDIADVFMDNEETFDRIRMFENFRENPESIDDLLRPKRP